MKKDCFIISKMERIIDKKSNCIVKKLHVPYSKNINLKIFNNTFFFS